VTPLNTTLMPSGSKFKLYVLSRSLMLCHTHENVQDRTRRQRQASPLARMARAALALILDRPNS
jgi:hypothetical protein